MNIGDWGLELGFVEEFFSMVLLVVWIYVIYRAFRVLFDHGLFQMLYFLVSRTLMLFAGIGMVAAVVLCVLAGEPVSVDTVVQRMNELFRGMTEIWAMLFGGG